MHLFVTSSPYIEGADRALLSNVNQFVDRIREVLPPYPNVLFICSNPEDHGGVCQFAAETSAAFLEAGIPFGSYQVLDGTNAVRAYALVSHSDLIILSGGHVPTQNEFFRRIRLRRLLHKFDGTVVGISAGSMNCAAEVYVQPEEPGESIDPDYKRFAPGLALTWVNICPHFQKVRHMMLDGKRLFEDITFGDSMGRQFFALPDNSYFYQDADGLLLCGEAYRIKDGILELLTVEDEVLDMDTLE